MKNILLFTLVSFTTFAQTPGVGVTDIDGNNYATVIIGTQEWMAENLRVTKYSNGDAIPNITDNAQWGSTTAGGWAYYNNNIQFTNPYGTLYNWYAASDSRNVCPLGWHVPTDAEWGTLINYLDPLANGGNNPTNTAGGKMKTTGTQYWQSTNTGATNDSGFSGLPSGTREYTGVFFRMGLDGDMWSSTQYSGTLGSVFRLSYGSASVLRGGSLKTFGYSVRCLNNVPLGTIELNTESKKLLKIVDLMGREVEERPNTVLIYLYTDGTIERKYYMEDI